MTTHLETLEKMAEKDYIYHLLSPKHLAALRHAIDVLKKVPDPDKAVACVEVVEWVGEARRSLRNRSSFMPDAAWIAHDNSIPGSPSVHAPTIIELAAKLKGASSV